MCTTLDLDVHMLLHSSTVHLGFGPQPKSLVTSFRDARLLTKPDNLLISTEVL